MSTSKFPTKKIKHINTDHKKLLNRKKIDPLLGWHIKKNRMYSEKSTNSFQVKK